MKTEKIEKIGQTVLADIKKKLTLVEIDPVRETLILLAVTKALIESEKENA